MWSNWRVCGTAEYLKDQAELLMGILTILQSIPFLESYLIWLQSSSFLHVKSHALEADCVTF